MKLPELPPGYTLVRGPHDPTQEEAPADHYWPCWYVRHGDNPLGPRHGSRVEAVAWAWDDFEQGLSTEWLRFFEDCRDVEHALRVMTGDLNP